MQRKWFKNKTYGYGWTPATKEGWLIVGIYFVIYLVSGLVFSFVIQQDGKQNSMYVWLYLGWILLVTTSLLRVAYKKGEKPEWRWGNKKPQQK